MSDEKRRWIDGHLWVRSDELHAFATDCVPIPRAEYEALMAFHDAWVECEVATATGSPEIYNDKRKKLIAAHQKAHELIRAAGIQTKGDGT